VERLWSSIVDFFENIPEFIETNFSNPVFWVILVFVVAGLSFISINNLGNK